MTIRSQSLAIVAPMLLFATNGIAASPQTVPPSRSIDVRSPEQSVDELETRRDAAIQEYEARIVEFKAGRSPANVALQANRRLLEASLATDSPNAAIQYDRRTSEIETFAQKNLELGTGTRQEVVQAKFARLDAILKGLLIRDDSSKN